MSLETEIEEFRKMVAKARQKTEQIDGSAKAIPDVVERELGIKFKAIQRELTDLSRQIRKTNEMMDAIVKKWNKTDKDRL
jgi:hypothetical protein